MNPFAFYDVLFIITELSDSVEEITENDIHLFAYLSCLLSIYRKRPAAFWGYNFAFTDYGYPFSNDLQSSIVKHSSSGNTISRDQCIKVSTSGESMLNALGEMSVNSIRDDFLMAACNCSLAFPIGYIRSSILGQYDYIGSLRIGQSKLLLTSESREVIYDELSLIKDLIGINVKDLLVPSTIWLNYLFEKHLEVEGE